MRRLAVALSTLFLVALLVLGSETPAFAALPTISSFSPTSGPAGCVLAIKGTNFDDPVVTSVDIGGTPVSAFKIVSGTEIWATVPAGGASGTIHVANASGVAASATAFTSANPGRCSPTITFVLPCVYGEPGWVVTIFGTNLLKSSGTATSSPLGGDVRFAPDTDTAMHVGTPETPTQLNVVVPVDVADGPIRVSTFNDIVGEGAVLSEFNFIVPPPEALCADPRLSRTITLSLRRHLVARGNVSVPGGGAHGYLHCAAGVPVAVQRRVSEGWKTVRSAITNDNGAYQKRIPDRPGRYRARSPEVLRGSGGAGNICLRTVSPVRIRS